MYVILVYDIKLDDNGPRVLRNVYKICNKYLTHIQNSTFEGELNTSSLKKLNYEIKKWIRKDRDSLIIFKSRDSKWLIKEFWGVEDNKTSNFL
ncbi:CRISPR-associated endonuclease Cas2 [Fusobacterium hominis]|uniref:CRISPR-associated endoribonuclease Cas2 n=1 Tax=Fusobacterium hominis TaxID=2764326 RepID=A0A7G9GWD3_9FUSO|nr:CRISPR-associated endonuclease Cas2 [Fusobacterium hominis]QNM15115.1 CRISPR-associated endonuclease Cas2 [Fusobacterium hominis]